jgi:lipopolysaccharide/colanic/teichoic acid biosynthesis glycosyltransferase
MQRPLLRTIDIFLALTGIIAGLPVLVAICILGFFDTGSPLFFQQRVGKNQALFTLIKFRTMPPNTSSVATHLADASSITKLGRVLRKTKLDELPQLLNVLFGQMSLVGPRPCLPNQTELVQERSLRGVFSVSPGITGLAQINEVDMSTPRKLARYDAIMIKSMTLNLYVRLIARTLHGQGRGDRIKN